MEQIKIRYVKSEPKRKPSSSVVKFLFPKNAVLCILSTLVIAGLFCSAVYVFAVPPDSKYDAGATLDPACTVGSANCSVVAPAAYSFGANNFSGSGGFTSTAGTGTFAQIIDNGLTASKVVFTDSNKQLTSTGTLGLDQGGTAASLTASTGGIVYSGASALAILSGTPTANKVLLSGASAAPAWSTATYPSTASGTGTILRADGTNWTATTATYPTTTTANQILYSTALNTIGGSAGLTFDGNTLSLTTTASVPNEKLIYDGSNYSTLSSDSIGNLNVNVYTGGSGGDIIFTPGTAGNPGVYSDSGTLILGSSKPSSYKENLSFDFEGTENTVAIGSGSGVTNLTWSGNLTMGGGTTGTLVTRVSSGAPTESDSNGSIVINSGSSPGIYYRYGGAWHYAGNTAGFQIPSYETSDPISGEKIKTGDIVLGMINEEYEDDALHGIWVKWESVKKQLLAEARGELSSAGSYGTGTISEVDTTPFLTKITNSLVSLGISFVDGVVHIKDLAVERSTTDIARIKKIEMIDQDTGEIYCTWIRNGEWVKVNGECSSISATVAASKPAEQMEGSVQQAVAQVQEAVEQAQEATKEAQEATIQAQEAAVAAEEAIEQPVESSEEPAEPIEQPAESEENASEEQNAEETVQETTEDAQEESEQETPSAGEIIQESAAGFMNSVWNSTKGAITMDFSFITPVSKLAASAATSLSNFSSDVIRASVEFIKFIFSDGIDAVSSAGIIQSSSAGLSKVVNNIKQNSLVKEFNYLINGLLEPINNLLGR